MTLASSDISSQAKDPRILWIQDCVVKLFCKDFTATEMETYFGELYEDLAAFLGSSGKIKYILFWRTTEPLPKRNEDDEFFETLRVDKYVGFSADRLGSARSPIDLVVLYFQRRRLGQDVPLEAAHADRGGDAAARTAIAGDGQAGDENEKWVIRTEYAEHIKVGLLNKASYT